MIHTATKIPFVYSLSWELRGLSPNFHIHVSVSDLYSPRIGPHIFLQQNRQIERRNLINRSQTHECGDWDCGCSVPFLRIFVSNFRCRFFEVQAEPIRSVPENP
jgi:hypothetical protein